MLGQQVTLLSCWLNLDFGWEKCAQHQGIIRIGPRQSWRYCSWQTSCDWDVRGNLWGEFEKDFPTLKREFSPREQMYGYEEEKGMNWKVEVDIYTLLIRCCCSVAKSYLTLLWPHGLQPTRLPCPWGILQARTLEWVTMPSSRGPSGPGVEPASLMSPALAGRFLTTRAIWEAQKQLYSNKTLLRRKDTRRRKAFPHSFPPFHLAAVQWGMWPTSALLRP